MLCAAGLLRPGLVAGSWPTWVASCIKRSKRALETYLVHAEPVHEFVIIGSMWYFVSLVHGQVMRVEDR
jgi:hypothetical protein